VVDLTAKPAAPAAPAAKPATTNNDTALELGGGALALLVLGGGAYALIRRRRRHDDELVDEVYEPETAVAHDPIFRSEPAMIAPAAAAFAWGDEARSNAHRRGETWRDRAMRGPTADNPSLSLKKRLKRAAFFDQRAREAAAGHPVVPVEADAGLPENLAEPVRERELEAA
jgi:resuscitation-promoting factor RpfA